MSDRDDMVESLLLLAHDLKNPLAAVLTNLGYVRSAVEALETPDAADVREAVLDARLACDALQRFVSNLEVLARDAAGIRATLPPDGPPLDLVAIADEIVERHRPSAEARRLTLEVNAHEATCWARADRDGVVRAVDNVVANAVQHAPAGTPVVVLIGPRGDREVELSVLDAGVVVPEDLRAEAMSRTGQGTAKGRPEARYGRGLGLYVAAASVAAAGGRFEIGARAGRSVLSVVLTRFEER